MSDKKLKKTSDSDKKLKKRADIEINKVVAALSYVSILFIIPLLLKKDSDFCQFHARQGLIIFLFNWLFFIPGLNLIFLIIVVVSIVKTVDGKKWKIPFVYEWSKKFNI